MPGFVAFLIEPLGGRPAVANMYVGSSTNRAEFMSQLQKLGFKVGLRLETGQRVQRFLYGTARALDVPLEPSDGATRDLNAVFPGTHGETWVGFVPQRIVEPDFVANNIARYGLSLDILPLPKRPQLLPVLVRYDNDHSFLESNLAGLWIIQSA